MEINIQEIAQKLVDELVVEQDKHKHRIEGVAMLFERLREAIQAQQKPAAEPGFTEQDVADINRAAAEIREKEKPRGRGKKSK